MSTNPEVKLRRIFGTSGKYVIGSWRKLRNERLYNLYSLLSIIKTIKLRRMKWTGHVTRKISMRNRLL